MKQKKPASSSRAKSMVMTPLYRQRVVRDKTKEVPEFRINQEDLQGPQ